MTDAQRSERGVRRRLGERGSVTVAMPFIAIMVFVSAGLVIDGGYTLAAKRRAMGHAEQAARVGSDALDQGALRDGRTVVNPGKARAAAQSYLDSVGASGSVSVAGGTVTVTVTDTQDMTLLTVAGMSSLTVTATGSATSINEDGLTP